MKLLEIVTTATSGNFSGLPPDEPPVSKSTQKKIQRKVSKKKWWEKWRELRSAKFSGRTILPR